MLRAVTIGACVLGAIAARVGAQAVPASEAFEALGESGGAAFQLEAGDAWQDAAATAVVPDTGEFWTRFLQLSKATGYEPLFLPYGVDGEQPSITLRRVDVVGEQVVRPAMAMSPLLVRPVDASVIRDEAEARRTLRPVQVAANVELFVEPELAWLDDTTDKPVAVYATAAGLRSQGSVTSPGGREFELILRRAAERDPSVPLRGGIGTLSLGFEADARVPWITPGHVGPFRAVVRVVVGEAWRELTIPLGREAGATVKFGAFEFVPGPLVDRPAEEGRPRRVTVSVVLPRMPQGDAIELGDWLRYYGFLQAIPPRLVGPGGAEWTPAGYAVIGNPDPTELKPNGEENGSLPGSYRVWAAFTAPEEASGEGGFELRWRLPTKASERRGAVVWTGTVPVTPPATRPAPLAPADPR